jgi:hypothetical protein
MRRRFLRGSAMPETALVISAVLIVFLGLIKLADVGYQQAETDAAAFVAAHEGSFASTTHQQTYGTSMSQKVFSVGGVPRFPFPGTASAGVNAIGATNAMPNPGGDVMGSAYHTSGGLRVGQAFGGNFFNLHSFFIEPAAGVPLFKATDVSLQITKAQPPNCTPNNTATPSCPGNVLATPDPTDTNDPYYTYACRALYYSALSNSSGFPPDPNKYFAPQTQDLFSQRAGSAINYVLPDSASLNALTDQSGARMNIPATANQPWPINFQPLQVIGQTSINLASTRASGMWLYPQTGPGGVPDPANQDGLAVGGGTIGLALQPIFNFDGGGGKC